MEWNVSHKVVNNTSFLLWSMLPVMTYSFKQRWYILLLHIYTWVHCFISDCSLPIVSGPCFAYFPRFSYHTSTNNCTRFVYGGCQGNANNFLTVEECNKACVHTQPSTHTNSANSTCSLPTLSGLCDAYFPRFSYHPDTNKCTQFIYGGCGGNQNNFLTENECNKSCVTS